MARSKGDSLPTLRQQQKEFTRERLVQAARSVFEESGYLSTTVDQIATAAGASKATFYLHFASKAEVLKQVAAELVEDASPYYQRLDDVLASGSRTELRRWMDSAVAWYETNAPLVAAVNEGTIVEPHVMEGRDNAAPLVLQMARYNATIPPSRQSASRLLVTMLILQLNGFFQYWELQHQWSGDRELVIDTLTDLWSRALQFTQMSKSGGSRKTASGPDHQ